MLSKSINCNGSYNLNNPLLLESNLKSCNIAFSRENKAVALKACYARGVLNRGLNAPVEIVLSAFNDLPFPFRLSNANEGVRRVESIAIPIRTIDSLI